MPRPRQQPAGHSAAPGIAQYTKLENRLVLLSWLNDLLGYKRNKDLLADTKSAAEGFDASGSSFLIHHLFARGSRVKIPIEDLERYDENIRLHLASINRGRTEPITLRYFQYLATLYTEIVLDRYFNHCTQLLADLNAYVHERNIAKFPGEAPDEVFAESDLAKLAFWMATGSGKTLLLHLNYHQFIHYNKEALDNILLITPNEGLSEQHTAELAASGIPVRRFDPNHSGLFTNKGNTVQVIEITKLVEEKKGGGVSVSVEAFEGRNLIFVDEGHKGSGGEAWRGYRDALGVVGFTFEYSATFGQALSAVRNDPLTIEYGKAIVFDYSYRYFYGDGYGKDFRILNLKEDTRNDQAEILLLGNLLSFYEQQHVFQEHAGQLRPYNIEKPLWVFVGSTVNAVYSENKEKRSDVLTVARFLHHVLENRRGWVVKGIEKLLAGKSGLTTQGTERMDIFAGRYEALRETGLTPQALYADILKRIFCADAGGGLHVCDIRGSAGELALKVAGAEKYFGLIYIGDTSEFKKLVETDGAGIVLEEDAISSSLFEDINRPDSHVHILIGAKKFMEGWNSWRVSNMGLLNIGRQEGSQIIQLFGRGVRLRGKGHSLKRSSALEGTHPPRVKLLETLNIFAVRANYMAQFRDYLEREGVETEDLIDLPLFASANEEFLHRGLVVPRPAVGHVLDDLLLEVDPHLKISVDMSVNVQSMESGAAGVYAVQVHSGEGRTIPTESLPLVDWSEAYMSLLAYKERKNLANLVIRPEIPREVIESGRYILVADEAVVAPQSFADRSLLQEAVTRILCKYTDKFYQRKREQSDSQHLVYTTLDKNDPNLSFNNDGIHEPENATYIVKVRRSDKELIKNIENLRKNVEALRKEESEELPRIYFDRHLYLPLLLEKDENVQTVPHGLNPSEERFVRDLKLYWQVEKDSMLAGKEVFLLRNLSRGSGVGFFEESGFYPDFILWVLDGKKQHIIFVEPHGMLHEKAYINDEKAKLHERLPALANEIAKRSKKKNITLDSFIVSATPYDELRQRYSDGTWEKDEFAEKHILFQERNEEYDYIERLFAPK